MTDFGTKDVETLAETLAKHYGTSIDLTTPRRYTARGGWNINCDCGVTVGESGDEDIPQRHSAHVSATLIASGKVYHNSEILMGFAQWVATNRAYNGSEFKHGQSLYNESLNGVLSEWVRDYLAAQDEEDER